MTEYAKALKRDKGSIKDFSEKTDVLIAGAGAAGLFCASILGQRGLKVTILESASRPGRKLAISGGGHANFTNLNMSPDKFLAPPDSTFCAPALTAWTAAMMRSFVEKAGFTVVEKTHGRLFLQEPAINLVKYLLLECQKHSVKIYYNERVLKLIVEKGKFLLLSNNKSIQAPILLLCLGSPARPKLASCLECWRLAAEIGHKVFPARPALTPLNYTGSDQDYLRKLTGIGLKVRLHLLETGLDGGGRVWEDDLLFTHGGLSGPSILSASLYYTNKCKLEINFLPNLNFEKLLDKEGKNTVRGLLRPFLPLRLVDALLPEELAMRKVAGISRKDRQLLGQKINAWQPGSLKAAGLDKAEICSGGVDLIQIHSHSMESTLHKGLYICGEMQNVSGELGGYNLHWAFASARLAAHHILSLI